MNDFISETAREALLNQNRGRFSEFDGPNYKYPARVERQETIVLGGRCILLRAVDVESVDVGYVTDQNSGRMDVNEQTGNLDGYQG